MTTSGLLEGYLSLTSGDGSCVELFNSCRTLHYVRESGTPLHTDFGCTECCCGQVNEGDYGANPAVGPNQAPWYNPSIPASEHFLGLQGYLSIGPVQVGTRTRQRLTYTGQILSTCDEGRIYGTAWVAEQFQPVCNGCDDFVGELFLFCGDETTVDAAQLDYPNPRPDETVGLECCPEDGVVVEPDVLGVTETIPVFTDNGQRQIMRLRYVRDSYQVTDLTSWVPCYGAAITFSFDLITPAVYSTPIPVCDLGIDDAADDVEVFDPCYCRPLEIDTNVVPDDCGRCLFGGCRCDQAATDTTSENTATPGYTDPEFGSCRWSLPLCSTRRTCVTPALPFAEAVPIITIEAGPTDVALLVSIWEAHPGLPDPATCLGHDIYCGRGPMVSPLQLLIPAGTTMVLDGRLQSVELLCTGAGPAGKLSTTSDGTRPTLPIALCNRRLWIAFDADCYNLPSLGHRITVEMAGRTPA